MTDLALMVIVPAFMVLGIAVDFAALVVWVGSRRG
jgi:hypothetical protein